MCIAGSCEAAARDLDSTAEIRCRRYGASARGSRLKLKTFRLRFSKKVINLFQGRWRSVACDSANPASLTDSASAASFTPRKYGSLGGLERSAPSGSRSFENPKIYNYLKCFTVVISSDTVKIQIAGASRDGQFSNACESRFAHRFDPLPAHDFVSRMQHDQPRPCRSDCSPRHHTLFHLCVCRLTVALTRPWHCIRRVQSVV